MRGFNLDYPDAERLGEAARAHDIAVSVHAPLAGFMGHLDLGKKYKMATGMLDHSAGLAAALGAEVTVFHPGYLLGRERRGRARRRRRAARSSSASGSRRRAGWCRSGSR